MDYKKMTADELIRIISNKALNKTLKENDKLVIQDCCKELFEKKCNKYKKFTYVKSKAYFDESDELCVSSKLKTRIVEIEGPDIPFSKRKHFPNGIYHTAIENFEEGEQHTLTISQGSDEKYVIIKIEDI